VKRGKKGEDWDEQFHTTPPGEGKPHGGKGKKKKEKGMISEKRGKKKTDTPNSRISLKIWVLHLNGGEKGKKGGLSIL